MKRLMMVLAFMPLNSFASDSAVATGDEFVIVAKNRVTMPDGTHCHMRYNARTAVVRIHRLHLTLRYLEESMYRGECAKGALIRVGRTRFVSADETDLKAGDRVIFTTSETMSSIAGATCALVAGNTVEVFTAEGERMSVRYHAEARTNDLECADGTVLVAPRGRFATIR